MYVGTEGQCAEEDDSMGREAKLAIGVLLLVVAGVVMFSGSQTDSPGVSPSGIAAVFGVPGLLLLAAGIMPPRDRRVTMTFVPARLFGGLALSLGGMSVLYLFYNVIHVAPQLVLVGALLAVPVGVLVAASSWTENPEQPVRTPWNRES